MPAFLVFHFLHSPWRGLNCSSDENIFVCFYLISNLTECDIRFTEDLPAWDDIRGSIVLQAFRAASFGRLTTKKEASQRKSDNRNFPNENVSALVADFQIGRPRVEADTGWNLPTNSARKPKNNETKKWVSSSGIRYFLMKDRNWCLQLQSW